MRVEATSSPRVGNGVVGHAPVARGRKAPVAARAVLTSANTFDWGSSPTLQRFAAAVLAPAAVSQPNAIDVDAASSAYWRSHWTPKPHAFMDGTPGKDALSRDAWNALSNRLGAIGSVICNPPGLANGSVIQEFWATLDGLHNERLIDSLFWIGFNLDQMRALIPTVKKPWDVHPLHARACTIFPGKRISYLAHPAAMVGILEKRLASRRCKGSERRRVEARRSVLLDAIQRGDLRPVPGPSPVHASYVTILWSHDPKIRAVQKTAAHVFLDAEATNKKSAFSPYMAIGDVP